MYENFLHKLFFSDPLPGPEEDNIILGYPEVNTVAPRLPPLSPQGSQTFNPFVPRKTLQNFAIDTGERGKRRKLRQSNLSTSSPKGSEMDAETRARLYMAAIKEANKPDSKAPAVTFGEYKTTETGRRLLNDLMRDYGISREYAAGIVGNLDYESGGFRTLQEMKPLVKGSRGGFGYAQWTGPRREAFEAFVKANSMDPTSYEANYAFLRHEFDTTREGRFLKKYKSFDSAEKAAMMFSNNYLRPSAKHANMNERIRRATAYALDEGIYDEYL